MVLYHAKCTDGFGAAWAAWLKLKESAQYIPVQYGEKITSEDSPTGFTLDFTGKEVYIVDFSFDRETLLKIADVASRVVLLDHHKTAEDDLKDLTAPNMEIQFDMGRSGAKITWDYFHPNTPNWLIDYVQDRDLWQFKLPQAEQMGSFLQSLPFEFEVFSKTFESGQENCLLLAAGTFQWMRFYVDFMKRMSIKSTFLGCLNIPVVNTPRPAISEVVGELSEGNLFAAGWNVREDGLIEYSLRSRGDFDVSALAKTMGGGGHIKAAGFSSTFFPHELSSIPIKS